MDGNDGKEGYERFSKNKAQTSYKHSPNSYFPLIPSFFYHFPCYLLV